MSSPQRRPVATKNLKFLPLFHFFLSLFFPSVTTPTPSLPSVGRSHAPFLSFVHAIAFRDFVLAVPLFHFYPSPNA